MPATFWHSVSDETVQILMFLKPERVFQKPVVHRKLY